MSLRIETEKVVAVQIGNEWHQAVPGTFDLDSYEFLHDGDLIHGGGESGVCATGFTFVVRRRDGGLEGLRMAGPLTAIGAVMYASDTQP